MTEKYGSAQAVRIAFNRSRVNEDSGQPQRWTELAVYYDPAPAIIGKPWIAVARGCSTHPGERTREEKIQVGTLKRALGMFDEGSPLFRSVAAQAEDWAETNLPGLRNGAAPREFANQEEALRWLYGDELEGAKPQTLLARDFGAGESTVRAALADGRDIKIPLLAALRFIDRDAFRRARDTGRG